MRIAVCIKQVPVVAAMAFDATSRTLKREGVPVEVSAFDLRAVTRAVELKQETGGNLLVVTMGPPQAREALSECLALGADRAVHLCDKAFAGADTLATARALAALLAQEKPDLIFCGRYSVDAETGQVGPEVAELLDIPQITQVRRLSISPDRRSIEAERETDEGIETVRASLPALVTATEDLAAERFPTKLEREAAKSKPCREVTAVELAADVATFGLAGSPTWVAELRTVDLVRQQRIFEGADIDSAAQTLIDHLVSEHGLFGEWRHQGSANAVPSPPPGKVDGPTGIWILGEASGDTLRPVTLELLGKARQLADTLATSVTVVMLGAQTESLAPTLIHHGADHVLLGLDPAFTPRTAEVHAGALATAIRERRPRVVLVPSTAFGRDVAPRVAARLQLGLTGDCIDLELDPNGRLIQHKPALGGLVIAPILSRTFPEMSTIRPGMFSPIPADTARTGSVERLAAALCATRVEVVAADSLADAGAALDTAEVVVGLGKGVPSAEIASIKAFAAAIGASICTTRDVVDDGDLPRHLQVGLTGRAIAPELYFAVGIRGAFEHMVGVRRAGIVVAINKNAKAPVFKSADYGIVGDFRQVVPALQRAWEARRSNQGVA